MRLGIVLFFSFLSLTNTFVFAQTFNGSGGDIPDAGATPTCFPINVTGIGTINNSFGLATVCLNITHTWDSDLEIALHAPDGTIVFLSVQNGGSGQNFTGTCFTGTALSSISTGIAPFTGSYLPDEPLGAVNNGQNANGTWTLCIQDILGGFTGTLNSWSISFSNSPAPPPPVQPPCSGNPPAGDDCVAATAVCNFSGYCGNTSSSYNADEWPELTAAFCGTLENNSFITFVASATTASFNIWVSNSATGNGIQMMFYDGGCGSGAVNTYGCYGQIQPSLFPTAVTATGLTIGNTYYLMFDGYAGDVCDYTIAPISGVNILDVSTSTGSGGASSSTTICIGESVNLTASGGNGIYTWTGVGLSSTTGSVVTATPTVTTVYTVTSSDPGGNCPITKDFTVNVTITPNPPVVTTPVTLCQNSVASPLTANGSGLLWYSTLTGGPAGSATAPIPSTAAVGNITYYVSQTLTCGESIRVPIVVNTINATPVPAVNTPVTFCQNSTANALTATGNGLLWYTNASGGTGSSAAPIPSTATPGNTIYYVTQNGNCGESPRAPITVTITPLPAPPTVVTPLTYCLGLPTVQLTAIGTDLHWYNFGSGGTALAAAPTPSSATIGNSAYYVSQTVNSCEGPRASIVVTIVAATATPVVTTPVVYCQDAITNPLSATGSGLLWYTTSTGGTGNSTAPTPSAATSGSVNYYVSQTTNCGESPRALITVTVNPTPSAPTVGSSLSYCIGATAVPLTATGSNLYWYTVPSGGSGISSLTPSTTSVGTTTYYVNQTILGCESPRASLDVTITGLPPAPVVNPSSHTYCQLESSQALTATGNNLLWYTSATGGTGSNASPIPSTLNTGTISYFVTQSLSCGESPRAEITVTVNPTPLAPQVNSPVVYCQGVNPSTLTANGNNLLWYNASSGGIGSSNAPTPSTTSIGNTSYFVSATTGSCEGPRAEIVVTVNITPAAPLVNSPLTFCKGNATNPLTATGNNLLWYTTATGGTGTNTSPFPSTNSTGIVAYYISQTIGICEGPRSNINVVTLATPNVGPDKKDTVCFGSSYDLTGVFNTTGLSVNWTQNGVPVIDPTLINASGFYQIDVTNSNGCADTALFTFNVRPPVIAFAGNDTIGVKNGDHQLFATGGERYEWTPFSMLNFSNIQNPIANLNDDQLFVVTVYNSIGCSDKDSVFIKVYQQPKDYYYIPSAFSPNGDGLNDIFRPIPVGINSPDCEWFRVYNRFGQLLFSTTQWMKGWDGKYKNNPQPIGTYVWSLGYKEKDGSTKVLNGSVLIVK